MTDLLEAAKAVIERWDTPSWKDVPATGEYIARLRVAVERAESDKADRDDDLFAVCLYGARTERERIKAIIKAVGVQGNSDSWFAACDTILEKLDDL